jgi:spore coat polysaccharide biosynthesis protein SpsF (cytidylyltransferase family)
MMKIEGRPIIWHVIQRVKKSRTVQKVIVATTNLPADDIIEDLCKEIDIDCFRGSSDDVLDRFYRAALKYKADIIVRITADCPIIDPHLIDKAVKEFLSSNYDYLSNTLEPTYPDGLDVEVFSFDALRKAWQEAKLVSEREHVTPYIRNHPEIFRLKNIRNDVDLSRLRWTVDEERDLKFVREIYKRLFKKKKIFHMQDVMFLLSKEPQLIKINEGITRNAGYAKSLKEDRVIR